jgi:hypothetical protein
MEGSTQEELSKYADRLLEIKYSDPDRYTVIMDKMIDEIYKSKTETLIQNSVNEFQKLQRQDVENIIRASVKSFEKKQDS